MSDNDLFELRNRIKALIEVEKEKAITPIEKKVVNVLELSLVSFDVTSNNLKILREAVEKQQNQIRNLEAKVATLTQTLDTLNQNR